LTRPALFDEQVRAHRAEPDERSENMAEIMVLSPVGELRGEVSAIPVPPARLRGLTVGFLDNTKHNFGRLVEGVASVLKERFGVARVVHVKKANAASPAAPDIITWLAKECDLVFAGSAD
jgi:hypothetical protein